MNVVRSFVNYAIFRELCDRMRFEVDCAKSHHRVISEGLTSTSSALADLLLNNLKTNKTETQTFLDRKLVVTLAHKPVIGIQDILTWAEALTIYLLVLCASQPLRWADVTL